MSKEKQIEEMARDICDIECKGMKCNECDGYGCEYRMQAEALYNAGYRKQSVGEWERRRFIIFDSEKVCYRCSECNTTWDAPTKFCPNCGAHMSGGNNDE